MLETRTSVDFVIFLTNTEAQTKFDLSGALKMALGGGLSGAAAMVLQVLAFMVRALYVKVSQWNS